MSLADLQALFLPAKQKVLALPDYSKSLKCARCKRPVGVKGDSPAVKVNGVLWHRACHNAYSAKGKKAYR